MFSILLFSCELTYSCRQTGTIQAAAKTSPSLSAANNTALMLAASLHQTLSASNGLGEFAALLNDMCQRCDLKFSTMDRYRDVGNYMLRSNVFACLLPSFIALHKEAVVALLEDHSALRRLETAFDDRFGAVEVGRMQEPMLDANFEAILEGQGANMEEQNERARDLGLNADQFGSLRAAGAPEDFDLNVDQFGSSRAVEQAVEEEHVENVEGAAEIDPVRRGSLDRAQMRLEGPTPCANLWGVN